jgi:hypothetical protein
MSKNRQHLSTFLSTKKSQENAIVSIMLSLTKGILRVFVSIKMGVDKIWTFLRLLSQEHLWSHYCATFRDFCTVYFKKSQEHIWSCC